MKIFQAKNLQKALPWKTHLYTVSYIKLYWLAHVMILSSLRHPSKKPNIQ